VIIREGVLRWEGDEGEEKLEGDEDDEEDKGQHAQAVGGSREEQPQPQFHQPPPTMTWGIVIRYPHAIQLHLRLIILQHLS